MEGINQIINWQGYKIEVTCDASSYDLRCNKGPYMIHIELRTLEPERSPLPVTKTGYRSHFAHAEIVTEYDTIIAFVQAWLDHAAKNNSWKQVERAAQQLCLL